MLCGRRTRRASGPGITGGARFRRRGQLVLGPLLRHVGRTAATHLGGDGRAVHRRGVRHRAQTFSVLGHHYAPGDRRRAGAGIDRRPTRCTSTASVLAAADVAVPAERDPHARRRAARILFGSCRPPAPHEPPWTLELDHDERVPGSTRCTPTVCGCSNSSPTRVATPAAVRRRPGVRRTTRRRGRARRSRSGRGHLEADEDQFPPLNDVADFEEYAPGCTTSRGCPRSSAGCSRSCRAP